MLSENRILGMWQEHEVWLTTTVYVGRFLAVFCFFMISYVAFTIRGIFQKSFDVFSNNINFHVERAAWVKMRTTFNGFSFVSILVLGDVTTTTCNFATKCSLNGSLGWIFFVSTTTSWSLAYNSRSSSVVLMSDIIQILVKVKLCSLPTHPRTPLVPHASGCQRCCGRDRELFVGGCQDFKAEKKKNSLVLENLTFCVKICHFGQSISRKCGILARPWFEW